MEARKEGVGTAAGAFMPGEEQKEAQAHGGGGGPPPPPRCSLHAPLQP